MSKNTHIVQSFVGIDDKSILNSLDTAIQNVAAVADYGKMLVEAGEKNAKEQIDRIHLVSMGSGAAIHEATAYWAYYQKSPLTVEAFSSTHYVLKPPPTLTKTTLVVFVSKSGKTSETAHAIKDVNGRCHSTVAFSKLGPLQGGTNPSLAGMADKFFPLGDTDQTFLAIGMYLFALTEAMYAAKQKQDASACLSSLSKLPELAVAAWKSSQDDARIYAQRYQEKTVMHVLYTGADKMVADVFGKCVLREANRISTVVEDAENVPHHSCELASRGNLFILILGGDRVLRPVMEKAREFYKNHTDDLIIYDLDKLSTDGISEQYRAQLGAFILYFATKGLGPAIAEARREDFTARRYMRKEQFDMTNYMSGHCA